MTKRVAGSKTKELSLPSDYPRVTSHGSLLAAPEGLPPARAQLATMNHEPSIARLSLLDEDLRAAFAQRRFGKP